MKKIFPWLFRLIPAGILLQTLYFKFSGHPESVAIFTQLGIEPYGRIGIGIVELITSLLILFPKTTPYGAALGLLLMMGAIFSHLTILGIETYGDGGKLFYLALLTAFFCLILIIISIKNAFKKN